MLGINVSIELALEDTLVETLPSGSIISQGSGGEPTEQASRFRYLTLSFRLPDSRIKIHFQEHFERLIWL